MADNRVHSAGKGDKPRPSDLSKYVSNFDEIDWTKKPTPNTAKSSNKQSKDK